MDDLKPDGASKKAVSLNDVAINQVSHQDDNVATGSSYQYVDWSKPSKDGWMAVQNPHLRMFSQVMCHITKEPFIPKHLNIGQVRRLLFFHEHLYWEQSNYFSSPRTCLPAL